MTEFKETDLYEPIRAFLEEEGYQVQAEVKHCDIAAEKDGRLVVVELKRAFGLKLVYQGLERQSLTDEVFAAATAKLVRNNRRWSENWMIGIASAEASGIGSADCCAGQSAENGGRGTDTCGQHDS